MTGVVVIDHRDSFAAILGDQFARAGATVDSVRCDVAPDDFAAFLADRDPDLVVLSPGPGHPRDAGVTVPWLRTDPAVPVLGVCLGHQALALAAGGRVVRANRAVHGRAVSMHLHATKSFPQGLLAQDRFAESRLVGARYHSLVVEQVPPDYELLASADVFGESIVMAMSHCEKLRVGLQFHPESILTPRGGALVDSILAMAVRSRGAGSRFASAASDPRSSS